ncbi:MAG: c-type cytochrome [Alphaproteobacteria bacterium]|nr:c-type cytochrome [Alphaproteobacteria bacterium]
MHLTRYALLTLSIVSFTASANYAWSAEKDTNLSLRVSDSDLSGGETTIHNTSREAFAKPLKNLPMTSLRDFTFGNKMFNTKWVTAPASVTSLDGLGPTFNRMSCAACHFKDGRGQPPRNVDSPMKSMLIRLSIPGMNKNGGPMPHPAYGGQLNDRGIQGVPAEGQAQITYTQIKGQYPDGTPYTLQKPNYVFTNLAYGKLGEDIMFSPRVAPAVYGLGLLDAIPEETILSLADPDDKDGDGISGRPNYVWDKINQKKSLGRYGWKANTPSIAQQDADAANGDIGLTSNLNPDENCPLAQKECMDAVKGDHPDISDKQLEKMTFYVSTLAVPARRDVNTPQVQAGAQLFERAKCSSCHTPQMRTGFHNIEALAYQEIQPFTDMLIHDMGEDLADNRPDFQANGREWRTAPLWGIGLIETVNKHTKLLHDGRARNIEEAILWHGGEAENSKEAFKAMNKEERQAMLAFLNSL